MLGLLEWEDQKINFVREVSQGRTASIKELDNLEANILLRKLTDAISKELSPMRKKVIHLMCLMGYVLPDNTPDYGRINAWLQRYGRHQKQLAKLNRSQLLAVLNQVDTMYRIHLKLET